MREGFVTSPLEIEIVIHYHAFPGQYRGGDFSAPAVKEGLQKLVKAGLLEIDDSRSEGQYDEFEKTPALAVYMDALCKVPFPVKVPRPEPEGLGTLMLAHSLLNGNTGR